METNPSIGRLVEERAAQQLADLGRSPALEDRAWVQRAGTFLVPIIRDPDRGAFAECRRECQLHGSLERSLLGEVRPLSVLAVVLPQLLVDVGIEELRQASELVGALPVFRQPEDVLGALGEVRG